MSRVEGLEKWDLAGVPEQLQVAEVTVFVAYPSLTNELLIQKPAERLKTIAQQMRARLEAISATGKLSKGKLFKDSNRRGGRFNRVRGEVRVADIPAIAQLGFVDSIQIENTNGERIKRKVTNKRKEHYYCVKMTVAIQIEGRAKGMQGFEERYILFKASSEDEAVAKAEEAALSYEKAYLNSAGELVRWKVESFGDVYEVVPDNQWNLNGAEVFSIMRNRKLTPERAWK